MSLAPRKMYRATVISSGSVAALMMIPCLVDLLAGYPWRPFFGQTIFDVAYLLSSMIVLYLCWHTWTDLQLGSGQEDT